MSKEFLIEHLNNLYSELRRFKRDLSRMPVKTISRKEVRDSALKLAKVWFEILSPSLSGYNISQELVKKYNAFFREIIKLSLKRNRKERYIKILDLIIRNFNDELLVSIIESQATIITLGTIQNILENATEVEEDYLSEAIGCARNNYLRASIVLSWNAAAFRMRKVIESEGLTKFNRDSIILTERKDRRYKGFDRKYNITSFNELNRIVPDNHLLLMLEYWEVIDSNQCDRLFTCYTMRCNSAHPGEAKITPANLASFYSDLKTMIFDNSKMAI